MSMNLSFFFSLPARVANRVRKILSGPKEEDRGPVDPTPHDPLIVVDVGAAGGLLDDWRQVTRPVTGVLFELNPEAAAALRSDESSKDRRIVVESALGASVGTRTLYKTNSLQCWSLLPPNQEFLSRYSIHGAFIVRDTSEISVTTYKKLHEDGVVPIPDVVKIDVQGFEHEVLSGFGNLLENCLAVQLETHIQPIYKDQHLIGDLVSLLASSGMALRRIVPTGKFDGDLVEFDAWFTIAADRAMALPPARMAKLRDIEKVWGLNSHRRNFKSNIWGNEW